MQSYRQYRALESAVREQLEACPDWKQRVSEAEPEPNGDSHRQGVPRGPFPIPGVQILDHPPSHGSTQALFLVGWTSEDDPLNPRNSRVRTRVLTTLYVSALAFAVSASSSIESAVLAQSSAAYRVSEVVASLFTAVFLLGFAAGSLVSGPLSEILGRNAVYTGFTSLFMLFIMGSGWSHTIGAKLACRFLAGVCGCPPLTCAGGTVADIWSPREKTLSFPGYAILSFGGAILSPVIASYMGQGTLSWRWVNWIVLIMGGLVLALIVLLQPETFAPLLLRWKARHFRRLTGDARFQSRMDLDLGQTSILSRITSVCARQFTLTVREPIILLLALYMTILYIVLFTFFDGYPYIFTDVHHLSQGLTNIVWVAMYVGIILAGLLVPLMYQQHHRGRRLKKQQQQQEEEDRPADGARERCAHASDAESESSLFIQPEDRLWYAMVGAPAIPISLFWMGWTDYSSISVWSPILGSSLFGFGSICLFISCYMYVIDAYEAYAASALGFMTITRYCAAGGMTVVGVPFYQNMGVHWTLTILGIISALMVPVPYTFWKYGPVIRGWSRFAV